MLHATKAFAHTGDGKRLHDEHGVEGERREARGERCELWGGTCCLCAFLRSAGGVGSAVASHHRYPRHLRLTAEVGVGMRVHLRRLELASGLGLDAGNAAAATAGARRRSALVRPRHPRALPPHSLLLPARPWRAPCAHAGRCRQARQSSGCVAASATAMTVEARLRGRARQAASRRRHSRPRP